MNIKTQTVDLLNAHNIRPSMQRIAVLDYLLRNRIHPTADEIYSALTEEMPTLSKTTVYNVLNNLVENGAIIALTIDEKNVRYDADTTEHAHFRCERCRKLFDIAQPKVLETPEGFKINSMHIYYWGICPDCIKAEKLNQ